MKRVIKFRAWDLTLKQMFEPDWLTADGTVYDSESYDQPGQHSPCELMQFTGLLDGNGKEIYEGDFINCGCGNFKVEFSNADGWLVDIAGQESYTVDDYVRFGCEVTGNVFENPELVKP